MLLWRQKNRITRKYAFNLHISEDVAERLIAEPLIYFHNQARNQINDERLNVLFSEPSQKWDPQDKIHLINTF